MQPVHSGRLHGMSALTYSTHSPPGPRVGATSCDHTGTTTAALALPASGTNLPTAEAPTARMMREFVVHVCMPQWPAISDPKK